MYCSNYSCLDSFAQELSLKPLSQNFEQAHMQPKGVDLYLCLWILVLLNLYA